MQGGCGGGVIDQQGDATRVGDFGYSGNICYQQAWVAGRFHPYQAGLFVDSSLPGLRVGELLDKTKFDLAALGKNACCLLVTLTESVQSGDYIVARAGDGEDQVE